MKTHRLSRRAGLLAAALLVSAALPSGRASDHADPMSLNPFQLQKAPAANITDLHAFIVDRAGKPVAAGDPTVIGDQLIISLCVQRAIQPQQISKLDLKGFKFRVHIDIDPPVHFFDEKLTREGGDYGKALEKLSDAKARSALISRHEADRLMQALYGGIISPPDSIGESVLFEYELDLARDEKIPENSQAFLTSKRMEGLRGKFNIVTKANGFENGLINVQAGVFDDPFIFPRFFRRNVVGIVTSIPLSAIPLPARHGPILVWATTHDASGAQIDHVGRSLRTQLPRFGYLNTVHPSGHVKAIMQVHGQPSIMEDVLATMLAPLLAHRHYDTAPDVMVYDLRKPAQFPNGRLLDDDVSKTLADAGETLLFELSYAESRQFPRATTNDKQFLPNFPYLAPRWTGREIGDAMQPGVMNGSFAVPRGGDPGAIAFANFDNSTWQTLWLLEVAAIVILTVLLLVTVRAKFTRVIVVVVALVTLCLLLAIHAPNLPSTDPQAMAQPSKKLCRLILGVGVIALFKISWIFALGRRSVASPTEEEPFPPGNQDINEQDLPTASDSYDAVKNAVFSKPYYGDAWGDPERRPLPIYKQTVASLVRGFFPLGKRIFLLAVKRTVRSRADLRWGADGKGFRRLLHPMGICLTGTWKITGSPADTNYTGCFAPGTEGRIIARYSTGGSTPFGGHNRSLALVGKIYPKGPGSEIPAEGPAHFFTQEDLGSIFTNNIREAVITNSPPVSPWNRGKDLVFLLFNGLTLLKADTKNTERQLYEIAELGKPKGTPTSCPRFMKLTVSDETPKLIEDGADFREEILATLYDRGNPEPTGRKLIFDIAVSDEGKKWKVGAEFLTGQNWTKIGQIGFEEAAVSYNGDFVIHFHHPVWRKDRNDPNSVARTALRRNS